MMSRFRQEPLPRPFLAPLFSMSLLSVTCSCPLSPPTPLISKQVSPSLPLSITWGHLISYPSYILSHLISYPFMR